MITIKSDRLSVEIASPGEAPNTTKRFDRAGFVTQVTLDNEHIFCSREPDNLPHPSSGGYGLCNEYQLRQPSVDAQMGEYFPKPGVGLLKKDLEGGYVLHHQYETDPYEIEAEAKENSVVFHTLPKECMGYAFEQTKTYTVSGNELTMKVELTNKGEKKAVMNEYCHNFVTIDKRPIGPEYFIHMPISSQEGKAPKSGKALVGREGGIGYTGYYNEPSMFDISADEVTCEAPFTWTITHSETPVTISETLSEKPSKIVIWTIDHIISPEVMCHIELEPGETKVWTRKWTFTD